MEIGIYIKALKKALKLKGYNYAKLGEHLGLSERSVARILLEETISFERVLKICNIIGITLTELEQVGEVDIEARDFYFSQEAEDFFAKNWDYILYYNYLYRNESTKEMAEEFNIDNVTLGKILSQLEKLDLLEWLPNNKAKIKAPRKFARPNGKIYQTHGIPMAHKVVDLSFEFEKDRELIIFLHLSKNAQIKYRQKLKDFVGEMRREMEIEALLNVPTDVVGFFSGMAPFSQEYDRLKET